MHRLLTGPRYAARYAHLAERAGVEVRTATSVTGWSGSTTLSLTSPAGLFEVTASAIVLATGCRERPRAARLIPGSRPSGVFTTGTLQQFIHLHHHSVGRRAVVAGAEHVSFSALLTLAHGGAQTVAMITEQPRDQTYRASKLVSATRLGVPILTSSRLTQILGRQRVEAVEVTDLHTGAVRRLDCDTVVFTGDWMPDNELARRGGLVMDPHTRAPRVDCGLHTSARGVFAAGNLLHGAETADVAALSGRHAARAAHAFLASGNWPDEPPLPVRCEPPLLWVSPSAIGLHLMPPPQDQFILRVREVLSNSKLVARQGEQKLWQRHHRRLVPNLPIHAPASWIADLDPHGDAVVFSVER